MSFLTRTPISRSFLAASRPAARVFVPSRAFGVTSVRGLKESDRHVEGQASKNEHHKEDQLNKQKEGKNHWKPELASDSEEAVAAERNHKDESPEQMQERTKSHAEEKHKAGTSHESGL